MLRLPKVTLRSLLLATTVLALIFASWKLATYLGLVAVILVISCETGASAGWAMAIYGDKKHLVIRGAIGGGSAGA